MLSQFDEEFHPERLARDISEALNPNERVGFRPAYAPR
jgi:hypothetical protein